MTFFLDENFPKTAAVFLEQQGHTVFDIRGTDAEGVDDEEIFKMAQQAAAILLTTDRDFFHTIPHLYTNHHGVIVITLRKPDRKSILAKLAWILDHFPTKSFGGRVILMRDTSYIVYPPLNH